MVLTHLIKVKVDEEAYADQSGAAYMAAEAAAAASNAYPVVYPEPFDTLGCGYGRAGEFVKKTCTNLANELGLDWECCHDTEVLVTLSCGTAADYLRYEAELPKRLDVVASWVKFKPSGLKELPSVIADLKSVKPQATPNGALNETRGSTEVAGTNRLTQIKQMARLFTHYWVRDHGQASLDALQAPAGLSGQQLAMANSLMAEAFADVMGIELDVHDVEHQKIWAQAFEHLSKFIQMAQPQMLGNDTRNQVDNERGPKAAHLQDKVTTTKQIVYLVTDNGVDGREATKIMQASFSEEERDAMLEADPSKAWRSKGEKIIDLTVAQAQALAKLDGVDRLALGLSQWTDTRSKLWTPYIHKTKASVSGSDSSDLAR